MTHPVDPPSASLGYIGPGKHKNPGGRGTRLVAKAAYAGRLVVFKLAVIGGLAGLGVLWFHLANDPLADVHAYYDAASRLNAGLPLYPPSADPDLFDFYRYPPLLAIVLRPLVRLPYPVFALLWEVAMVLALFATLRYLGFGRRTWLALGILGLPVGFVLGVGQAQMLVTYLQAVGQPWSIALGGQLKLFPLLIAVWWLGRRNWQALGALLGWSLVLIAFQVVLEPTGSRAFLDTLTFGQVGHALNISPYAVSPILWVVAVAAGGLGALLLAPTRWGWAAAVSLATLASPRLLSYMLTGLLAAVREPDRPRGDGPVTGLPDLVEVYRSSVR